MVEIKEFKRKQKLLGSVTIKARKPKSNMRIGNSTYKISGILHTPQTRR